MITILSAFVSLLSLRLRSCSSLELELVALRHQVAVFRRQRPGRLRLFFTDRLLWVWLYRVWPQVLNAMRCSGNFRSRSINSKTTPPCRTRRSSELARQAATAALPPIPGLKELPYLTNESIFDLTEQSQHLIVIGGGPIGVEIAQSFRRLGSKVQSWSGLVSLPKMNPRPWKS
jgi:hypothetical protein